MTLARLARTLAVGPLELPVVVSGRSGYVGWHIQTEGIMGFTHLGFVLLNAVILAATAGAADLKVNLSQEQVGKPPAAFEPMVGTWVIAQDGNDKVIMVDGRPWVASKDNPTKLLLQTARKLYGTSNEELMDNAKQFAYYPVAVLQNFDNFSNGTISMKFKTVAGDSDRCSGILFNVKPNGDWLAVRYNDTENNVAFWEFHNGIRRNIKFSDRSKPFPLDRNAWHELKMTVAGADFKAWLARSGLLCTGRRPTGFGSVNATTPAARYFCSQI
jgi:hypothetical protein